MNQSDGMHGGGGAANMMGSREPLRIKLSDQERGYYSNIFSQVNPDMKTEVASNTIVQFLLTSGLDIQTLKRVWEISASTSNNYLIKEEFYVALRLVALIQSGQPATAESIINNVPASLPRFDDYVPATPGADPVRPG